MKNVAVVVKVLSIGEAVANRVVPYFYDLIAGNRWVTLSIVQKNGLLTTNILNASPSKPKIWANTSWEEVNKIVTFNTQSEDIDGDNIAYRFHWGDGTSTKWSSFINSKEVFSSSHTFPNAGIYNVVVEAKDENGGVAELSESFSIQITQIGVEFYYNFNNDVPGLFPSNPPWTSKQNEPSYLRVVNNQFYGSSGNSCAFFDSDPLLDDSVGSSAMITSNIVSNAKGSIEFVWKVSSNKDHFGLRSWEDWEWNKMGYYVLINGGKISYYENGNFNTLLNIQSNRWYKVKLKYDIPSMKYSIFIDGVLKKSDVPFVGSPNKLQYLQIVAFSDANCKAAYIDEIKITKGSLLKTMTSDVADIPTEAMKIIP